VATTAESYSVKRAPARAPLSTHPAFPAIVALWFAALLGIGSLVLPVALIERIVAATRLASVLPSAAPPLGFAARGGIALGCAVAGALLGLALARKVAQAHTPEPRGRQFTQARECRPISAHDELGEDGLEAEPARAHKRRVLAIAEDDARSTFLATVPVPGESATEAPALPDDAAEAPVAAESDALDLSDFADLEAIDEFEGDDAMPDLVTDPTFDAPSEIDVAAEPPSLQDQPMTDLTDRDTNEASEAPANAVDPLPFAAPSLRRAESAEVVDAEEQDEAVEEPPVPHLSLIEDYGEPEATDDDDRPLAELGLVQLAARLGASLERRKAQRAAPVQAAPPAALAPLTGAEDFEAAGADDAARAIAEFFGPAKAEAIIEPEAEQAATVPPPLRAWSIDDSDEADDDNFVASFSLPLGGATAQQESFDEEEVAEVTQEDSDGTDYSSLLAIGNPFARQPEFVRVEEPEDDAAAFEPAVTFPSPSPAAQAQAMSATRPFDPPPNAAMNAAQPTAPAAPRDPDDAERNLRAALATLQRMGGAA
jgi:hypothetical protein